MVSKARAIGPRDIDGFTLHLRRLEKSPATIEKYKRYATVFAARLNGRALTKDAVVSYKEHVAARYTASGANGMLAAVNSLLTYLRLPQFKVRPLRVQKRQFIPQYRELCRADLRRLLDGAATRGQARLALVMQTIFATGIRVSELKYITAEAVSRGQAEIRLKGKSRAVFLPTKLCKRLCDYARQRGIRHGPVFITRGGRPLDRSNIWADMKRLSAAVSMEAAKVFPHNLRRLFARTYYEKLPNLAELADIMGHSDINTTRIYTSTTGAQVRRRLDSLNLVT